jgi:hypothetical protein
MIGEVREKRLLELASGLVGPPGDAKDVREPDPLLGDELSVLGAGGEATSGG